MTTTLIETLQSNLEAKCMNMGNCIQALSAQGYLVNAAKRMKLNLILILLEQIKYIDTFDESIQNRVVNLFNRIS